MKDNFDTQIQRAYEWLTTNPDGSLNQAARRFRISDTTLKKALRERYGYSAQKAYEERKERQFKELCSLWPKIKHELDTTEDRALDIMNRYGYGQNSLNALVRHFDYKVELRANRIRQAKRARTLNKNKPVQTKSEIEGARYMALCMPWSKSA